MIDLLFAHVSILSLLKRVLAVLYSDDVCHCAVFIGGFDVSILWEIFYGRYLFNVCYAMKDMLWDMFVVCTTILVTL